MGLFTRIFGTADGAAAQAPREGDGERQSSSGFNRKSGTIERARSGPVRVLETRLVRASRALEPEPAADSGKSDEIEVNLAFEQLAAGVTPSGASELMAAGDAVAEAENNAMFHQMALSHARPLREFLLELGLGPTSKRWLQIARAPAERLQKGAAGLEQWELTSLLASFLAALDAAERAAGSEIRGAERASLLFEYGRLAASLPLAFELEPERELRESLIVFHLLGQVPGVHKHNIDKLCAAGLGRLDALAERAAVDLVEVAGVELACAVAMLERVHSYCRERRERPSELGYERVKEKLRALLYRLSRAHQDFERADASAQREQKRLARAERRSTALEVNVLLAQLGEVELLAELERASTERRIDRLFHYIEEQLELPYGRSEVPQQEAV